MLRYNPDELCFAVRLVTRHSLLNDYLAEKQINWFLSKVIPTLQEAEEAIEWSEIDKIIELWFRLNYCGSTFLCWHRNWNIFWDILQCV